MGFYFAPAKQWLVSNRWWLAALGGSFILGQTGLVGALLKSVL